MSAAPQPQFSVASFPIAQKSSILSSRQAKANALLSDPTPSQLYSTPQVSQSPTQIAKTGASSSHNFVPRTQNNLRFKRLLQLQRLTFGISSLLMVSSALVYVAGVRTPQLWSQEYERLEILQRQERELTAANETLKQDLVRQAEQKAEKTEAQLSYLQSDDVIFLETTKVASEPFSHNSDQANLLDSIPLSY
ncbi:MAG TPA: hypothetical protein ACFCUY_12535 [Xenococcaceae cyanobacterium]